MHIGKSGSWKLNGQGVMECIEPPTAETGEIAAVIVPDVPVISETESFSPVVKNQTEQE